MILRQCQRCFLFHRKSLPTVGHSDPTSLSFSQALLVPLALPLPVLVGEVVPAPVPNLISLPSDAKVAVLMPSQPGAYRLFVEVLDDAGGVGHANLPFYVREKD